MRSAFLIVFGFWLCLAAGPAAAEKRVALVVGVSAYAQVARLPGYRRWLWDGEFCGSIDFRWQPGTTALPPHCLGHIGYGVVPWKQGRGYATRALSLLLPAARAEGLAFVSRVVLTRATIAPRRCCAPKALVPVAQCLTAKLVQFVRNFRVRKLG